MMRASDMVRGIPHYTALVLGYTLFVALLMPVCAHAQVPTDEAEIAAQAPSREMRQRAASLFDTGVRLFAKAQYKDAAQSFLEADAVLPNSAALANAITAAMRAHESLLAARAAERAIDRRDVDPRTVQAAHEALAAVTPALARLDLECEPVSCKIQVDGSPAKRGVLYVAPGRHRVVGETAEHAQVVQHVECAASAICRLHLQPGEGMHTESVPLPPVAKEDVAPAEQPATPQSRENRESPPPLQKREWLPLGTFVASASLTGLFVALTTWSGIDALNARDLHETHPDAYDPGDVHRRARRTDFLLATSLVLGAATAVSGVWWFRSKKKPSASISLVPNGGFMLCAEGRF
jgi:hypothetical protein